MKSNNQNTKIAKLLLTSCFAATISQAEFIRVDSKDVVVDTTKNLMWQDASYTKDEKKAYYGNKNNGKAGNWEYAKEYCEKLSFAG